MGELVKVNLNGTELWMETEQQTAKTGPVRVSKEDTAKKALEIADKLQSSITGYCCSLMDAFNSMEKARKPTRVSAEFGLKLSGDLNVYVVNAGSEASLKITAEWDTR